MKRSRLNLIVDVLNLIVLTMMVSTGLILKNVLPPGSGRIESLLKGGGGMEKTIDVFVGLTRQEWGQIHFVIAVIFVVLLMVHLFLHWNWIQSMIVGSREKPTSMKMRLAVCVVVFLILSILAFPGLGRKQTMNKSEFLQTHKALSL